VIESFAGGFAEGLGIELVSGSLETAEEDQARSLERDCYATREWTVYGRRPTTTPARVTN
jgi:hypothetical protein